MPLFFQLLLLVNPRFNLLGVDWDLVDFLDLLLFVGYVDVVASESHVLQCGLFYDYCNRFLIVFSFVLEFSWKKPSLFGG